RGIEALERKGDQIQWGGRTLYADGRFATSDGKAHFSPISITHTSTGKIRLSLEEAKMCDAPRLLVSTRRGKQFNSMVQREVDPLTGARRNSILMSNADIRAFGLRDGAAVRLRSDTGGVFEGFVQTAKIRQGNLEVHWPEGNVLLSGTAIDPDSMEPDY